MRRHEMRDRPEGNAPTMRRSPAGAGLKARRAGAHHMRPTPVPAFRRRGARARGMTHLLAPGRRRGPARGHNDPLRGAR